MGGSIRFDVWDWSILIAYFVVLIIIGMWASSKRRKKIIFSCKSFLEMVSDRFLYVGN